MKTSASDRFWKKVTKSPSGCWEWTGFRNKHGYGQFWTGEKLSLTHRYSLALSNGAFDDSLCVLHKCDNPPCVNPSHLAIGSQADNVADMMKKGRSRKCAPDKHGSKTHPESIARGESKPASKLKERNVLEIRQMLKDGLSQRKIASLFNV